MKFTVQFDTIRCRCGEWRQRSVPCLDCGEQPKPWEVDTTTQKRAAAVARLRFELVETPLPCQDFDPVQLTSGGFGDILFPALKAADRFATGGEVAPFRDGLLEVVALRAWAERFEPLRPALAVGQAARGAALATADAADAVLDALAAPTMAEAFEAERTMNKALDAASTAIGAAADVLEVLAYVEQSGDPMTAWLRPLFEQEGPLEAAVLHAAEQAETVLSDAGIHVEDGCPSDLAATVAALDVAVSAVGDPEAFWTAVASHWKRLVARPDRLGAVLSDPGFARAAAATTHDGWARMREWLNAETPDTLRQAVTSVLRHGHAAIEGPVHHLYAAARATGKGEYEQFVRQDAGDNLAKAEQQGWHVPQTLLDKAVRNAYAHIDFEVTDDDLIALSARSRKDHAPQETLDQLVDQVLEIEETANALLLAFVLAATTVGLDLPDILRDIPAARITEHMLHAFGWDEAAVRVEGDAAHVNAARATPARLVHVMAVVTFLPPHVQRVRFDLTGPADRTATVEAPVERLREWPHQPDTERDMFFLGLLTQVMHDACPVIPPEGAVDAFVLTAGRIATDSALDSAHKTHRLRALVDVARTFGLDEAAARVKKVQAFHTAAVTGLPLPESALDGVFVSSGLGASQLDRGLFESAPQDPDESAGKSGSRSNRSKRKRPRRDRRDR